MSLPKLIITNQQKKVFPCPEIFEYAKYIGIDPNEDSELLYIAREGLNAPLPENWKACKSETDEIYYFNVETGVSQWEHPLDNVYRLSLIHI